MKPRPTRQAIHLEEWLGAFGFSVHNRTRTVSSSVSRVVSSKGEPVKSLLILFIPCILFAQAPPSVDIYYAEVVETATKPEFKNVFNFTNHRGYDNQPSFMPSGEIVFASDRADGKQVDIFKYSLIGKTLIPLISTPESEFSPTPMPDGRGLSVVRVEMNGTQRIWRFNRGGGSLFPVAEKVKGVGYHLWLDNNQLACFIVGEPHKLVLVDLRGEKVRELFDDPGRGMARLPGGLEFLAIKKAAAGSQFVKVNVATGEVTTLFNTVAGAEDFAVDPFNRIWMASGSKIFRTPVAGSGAWEELGDFAQYGATEITRIALSENGSRIAFVSAEPAE